MVLIVLKVSDNILEMDVEMIIKNKILPTD